MKRKGLILIGLAAGTMMTLFLSGCGKTKDDTIARIQSAGVINVAVPNKDSAFLYLDESGSYAGTDAELVDSIASALGVGIRYIPDDTDSFTNLLTTGGADIAIGTISSKDYDTTRFSASESYGSDFLYVITPRGVYPGDLCIFDDQEVGIEADLSSNAEGSLYVIKNPAITKYRSIEDAASDLEYDRIKAFFCYSDSAEKMLELGDFQIQNVADVDKDEYVILTGQDRTQFLHGVNICIQQYLEAKDKPAESEETEADAEEE